MTELLIVIGIVCVLALLAFPVMGRISSHAKRLKCGANLTQLATANLAYAQDHQGKIAAGSVNPVYWWLALRPYLGGTLDANNLIEVLICPSDPNRGIEEGSGHPNLMRRSYGLNRNLQAKNAAGVFIGTEGARLNAFSAPSRIAYLGDHEWWHLSTNFLNANQAALNSIPKRWHDGWCNLVFLDGHVEPLRIESLYPGGSHARVFDAN